MEREKYLKNTKRIVVKAGTSLLTNSDGKIDNEKIKTLVSQVCSLANRGYEVLLVSSGSIAAGIGDLELNTVPSAVEDLQAAAAIGQGILIHQYSNLFKNEGIKVGQVLLTRHDTTHREQYVNAKNTLNKLIEFKVIPIINENDSTVIDEIKFGDNDTLAALVANMVEADLLIILSDVDGLYRNISSDRKEDYIKIVDSIDSSIEEMAGGSKSELSKGGMETKIRAAKMATAGRTAVVIANGRTDKVLEKIVNAELVGTFFIPHEEPISARKLWILNQPTKGSVIIDKGAFQALLNGKSLLAAGVIKVESEFKIGDVVSLKQDDDKCVEAIKGITNFDSKEIKIIAGKKHSEIVELLNNEPNEEVVHRDDMVIDGVSGRNVKLET